MRTRPETYCPESAVTLQSSATVWATNSSRSCNWSYTWSYCSSSCSRFLRLWHSKWLRAWSPSHSCLFIASKDQRKCKKTSKTRKLRQAFKHQKRCQTSARSKHSQLRNKNRPNSKIWTRKCSKVPLHKAQCGQLSAVHGDSHFSLPCVWSSTLDLSAFKREKSRLDKSPHSCSIKAHSLADVSISLGWSVKLCMCWVLRPRLSRLFLKSPRLIPKADWSCQKATAPLSLKTCISNILQRKMCKFWTDFQLRLRETKFTRWSDIQGAERVLSWQWSSDSTIR